MMDFLIEKDILKENKNCPSCSRAMKLEIRNRTINYRCVSKSCRKRFSIVSTNLGICSYINIIYLIITECSYKQLKRYHNLTNKTIFKIKKKLKEVFKIFMERHPIFLGGPGKIVEIDETVLSRRQIIKCPTSIEDDFKDTIWILGAIDNTPQKNFYIKQVENRQINTLSRELEGKIKIGTIVCTDGYSSYPQTCNNLALEHRIVNHSEGFVAEDGTHTNNIEGFWSHLKSQMRKENGVKRENLNSWLIEYEFKRRYLMNADNEEIIEIFLKILKILMNE